MNAKNLLYCSLILFSTALYAEETNKASEFNMLDKSGNGYLTVEEAKGNTELLKKWDEVDKNTDGLVDFIEFSAFETQAIEAKPEKYIADPEDEDYPEVGAAPTEVEEEGD